MSLDEAALFAKLDPALQVIVREALAAKAAGDDDKASKLLGQAWKAVFKERTFWLLRLAEPLALPLDTKVNDAQTLAEVTFSEAEAALECLAAAHNLRKESPEKNAEYRKLLGIDPGGVLQQHVRWTFGKGGRQADVPLWFALQALTADNSGVNGALYGLPEGTAPPPWEFRVPRMLDTLAVAEALQAHVAYASLMTTHPPGSRISGPLSAEKEERPLKLFARIDALTDADATALVPWAEGELDRLAVSSKMNQPNATIILLAMRVMLRAKQPFKPAWDWLVPVSYLFADELLAYLPSDRRSARMVTATTKNAFASYAVNDGLALLKKYPERGLLDATWSRFPDSNMSTTAFGKAFKEALAGNEALLAVVAEKIAAFPKPIKLICTASSEPKKASELTDVQKKQLRAAGKMYDDQDLPAETRLGDPNEETTLSLTLRTLADPKGAPLYDVFLYNADSGTVFRSETLEVVAQILQGSIECDNAPLGDALKPLIRGKVKITAPNPRKPTKDK